MADTIDSVRSHPWNNSFRWTAPPGRGGVLDASQLDQFDRSGHVVVKCVLDASTVREVAEVLDVLEAEQDAVLAGMPGGRRKISESGAITFTTHLVARSPVLRALSLHPTLAGICADLIDSDADLYWDQAVYKKPQKPRPFPWHQDNGYTFVDPQQYLTCWIALTPAMIDNGCPVLAPGFHRLGTLAHRYVDPLGWECLSDPADVVTAEVDAGDVVVFSSLTPHFTGPNITDQTRKAYIVQYAPRGAVVLRGDPAVGPPTHVDPCDSPDLNYPVVRSDAAGRRPASTR